MEAALLQCRCAVGLVLSGACWEHHHSPVLRQTGGRHSPLSSAAELAKCSGGSWDVQRAEAKWCCSLCVLISEQQESIHVMPFLTPQ